MKVVCATTILILALLAGCSPAEKKAAELLETARFEEKQSNLEHARKLYDEILKKYPDSSAAKDASLRMTELDKKNP